MPIRNIKSSQRKLIYRNERFTKGTITSNDPLYEGSFRRLINFDISNQNASLNQREPFITVPLYDTQNKQVKLSTNSIAFSFNEDTNYSYIVDFKTKINLSDEADGFNASKVTTVNKSEITIIDGDTISYSNKRYRFSLIDTPELDDNFYTPIEDLFYNQISGDKPHNLGEQAKLFVEKELKIDNTNNDVYLVQFEFQTELIDEFGRELIYVFYKDNDSGNLKLINVELLRKGYASFYNFEKYKKNLLIYELPGLLHFKIDDTEERYNLFDEINESYKPDKYLSAYSNKYLRPEFKIEFKKQTNLSYYSKPKVYKITKNTNLEKAQVEFEKDGSGYKTKVFKRVVDEFELMELNTKFDLELPNDYSLRYELVSREHEIINSKYGNQTLNFFVRVYDIDNTLIYTGPAEITKTSPDPDNGIYENFQIKTYKKPEMLVELQDITNYKPNILNDSSIIPKTLTTEQANVQGFSNPSVDAVLLSANLNEYLTFDTDSDNIQTKYFLPNTARNIDLNNLYLTPHYKAPIINGDKNTYMYRWDIISNKEIDLNNLDQDKVRPIFRTQWRALAKDNKTATNIFPLDEDKNLFAKNLKLSNIKTADEIYIVTVDKVEVTSSTEEELFNNLNNNIGSIKNTEGESLLDFDTAIKEQIEGFTTYQEMVSYFRDLPTISFPFGENDEKEYKVRKIDKLEILKSIGNNKAEDKLVINIKKEKIKNNINASNRQRILNSVLDNKKIAFIFLPFEAEITDDSGETEVKREIFFSTQTFGIVFEHIKSKSIDFLKNEALPPIIDFKNFPEKVVQESKLITDTTRDGNAIYRFEEKTVSKEEFLKDGFTAVFYLLNYDPDSLLTEESEYYDNLAYKASSATYTFKSGSSRPYQLNDFINDRLEKESYMIKYCKYITQFNDRAIVYGNPTFNNLIFMSEEGSPYYYSLVSAFEFDHEVIHVQEFKTILMVFTTNDIWVIYEVEEKEQREFRNQEGEIQTYEVTNKSFRSKKILYNISTTHENKSTIKNISRYVTLMSNDVLYLIKPSLYISDDTQFTLNILSTEIDALVKDPLKFINERLIYYGINEKATEYKMNLNATDNFIKLYYSTEVNRIPYTLILTFDILNKRWYEEDTISFGYPQQIYMLDATTKHEMLTQANDQLYITYNTDKFKNLLMNEYGESYFDIYPTEEGYEEQRIEYYIDTGNIKLSEHLMKRFRRLHINMKNIDSKEVLFSYNFSVDDIQFENNVLPEITINDSNTFEEVTKVVNQKKIFNRSFLDDFFLDFSNFSSSDIITLRHNLLGKGRIPRIKMSFSAKGRFYILSYGITYSERRGN